MDIRCAYDKMVPIGELKPHPRNPNRHPEEQIRRLAKLMEHHGWRAPVTVSKRSGLIVRGHARREAGEMAGFKKAPVDYQNYTNEREEIADMMADNAIQELCEFDSDLMRENLLLLRNFQDFDMEFTGLSQKEAERMLSEYEPKENEREIKNVETSNQCPRCGYEW